MLTPTSSRSSSTHSSQGESPAIKATPAEMMAIAAMMASKAVAPRAAPAAALYPSKMLAFAALPVPIPRDTSPPTTLTELSVEAQHVNFISEWQNLFPSGYKTGVNDFAIRTDDFFIKQAFPNYIVISGDTAEARKTAEEQNFIRYQNFTLRFGTTYTVPYIGTFRDKNERLFTVHTVLQGYANVDCKTPSSVTCLMLLNECKKALIALHALEHYHGDFTSAGQMMYSVDTNGRISVKFVDTDFPSLEKMVPEEREQKKIDELITLYTQVFIWILPVKPDNKIARDIKLVC